VGGSDFSREEDDTPGNFRSRRIPYRLHPALFRVSSQSIRSAADIAPSTPEPSRFGKSPAADGASRNNGPHFRITTRAPLAVPSPCPRFAGTSRIIPDNPRAPSATESRLTLLRPPLRLRFCRPGFSPTVSAAFRTCALISRTRRRSTAVFYTCFKPRTVSYPRILLSYCCIRAILGRFLVCIQDFIVFLYVSSPSIYILHVHSTFSIKFSPPIALKKRPRYSRTTKSNCDYCVFLHCDRVYTAIFTLRLRISLRFPSCVSAAFSLADQSLFLRLQLPRYSPRFSAFLRASSHTFPWS
jgi:hypothetical protein